MRGGIALLSIQIFCLFLLELTVHAKCIVSFWRRMFGCVMLCLRIGVNVKARAQARRT